jgi:hypothetical protein
MKMRRRRRPFHGVSCPTAHQAASSDLHRVCLTRLSCASRFSQPLDALFRSEPLRPCFMPVTPLGFRFQRFPLPGSGCASRRSLSFMPFPRGLRGNCQVGDPTTHGFKDLRIRRVRSARTGVTRDPPVDPLLAFTSSRCSPHRPWLRASTKPPLMGFVATSNGANRSSLRVLFRVSKSRRSGRTLARSPNRGGFHAHLTA